VREAMAAVIELEHFGVPFSRTPEGKYINVRWRHDDSLRQRHSATHLCAADKTGHAICIPCINKR